MLGEVCKRNSIGALISETGTFSERTISVDNSGWHLEVDERYVRSVLDKSVWLGQGKSAGTLEARRR